MDMGHIDLFGPRHHGEPCWVGQEVAIGRDADGFPIPARITDMKTNKDGGQAIKVMGVIRGEIVEEWWGSGVGSLLVEPLDHCRRRQIRSLDGLIDEWRKDARRKWAKAKEADGLDKRALEREALCYGSCIGDLMNYKENKYVEDKDKFITRIRNFLFTWKCGRGSGIPVCCIIWASTICAVINRFARRYYVRSMKCSLLNMPAQPKPLSVRFMEWYQKSQGVYLHYKGWVEADYNTCPVCLVFKRVKEIKFCRLGDAGCQDKDCLERLRIQAGQPKQKGILMRAGYSYNVKTGEEKKLDIEKAPVWPWSLFQKSGNHH